MSLLARFVLCAGLAAASPAAASSASPVWSSYLDYAYVYSSADAEPLRARLEQYAAEAGLSLPRYIGEYFETLAPLEVEGDEAETRRKAVAYLLDYLARGDSDALDAAVASISELEDRLGRHENRYWYHYIRAHRSLEKGYAREFVAEVLNLWLGVVVPLEATYETLDTLALREAPNSGFVAALPYVHENLARLILLRTQQLGVDRDLDSLGAIVRLLHDGRVGAYPDVIPAEASSRDYLERIVQRLDGPESDGGSLTFTLALFEATQRHEHARGLLAQEGLGDETLRAVRSAGAAYETALNRARTAQGECAVYTRVLRQLGELYAAKQRLGVDPPVDLPFSIEGAVEVYGRLRGGLDRGWERLGYRSREPYLDAMRRLWEEIQEASLNTADYYLTRAVDSPHRADEHSRNAARVADRYLSFFQRFATESGRVAVPDSAYFAAYEAARNVGDAYLRYANAPSRAEVELGTHRYRSALGIFPFDRPLWSDIAAALGRHGRESEYADVVRPVSDRVTRLRSVQSWLENGEANGREIASMRQALADELAAMYLGFAEGKEVSTLEAELDDLAAHRQQVAEELELLATRRDGLRGGASESPPAAPDDAAWEEGDAPQELARVAERLAEQAALLEKLERQLAARSRALPHYKRTLGSEALTHELRSRRDHPVHVLLRRMYHEGRAPEGGSGRDA
jgi:hypothetical protein